MEFFEIFDIKALLEKVVPNQAENNVFQSQFLVAKVSKGSFDTKSKTRPFLILTFCIIIALCVMNNLFKKSLFVKDRNNAFQYRLSFLFFFQVFHGLSQYLLVLFLMGYQF